MSKNSLYDKTLFQLSLVIHDPSLFTPNETAEEYFIRRAKTLLSLFTLPSLQACRWKVTLAKQTFTVWFWVIFISWAIMIAGWSQALAEGEPRRIVLAIFMSAIIISATIGMVFMTLDEGPLFIKPARVEYCSPLEMISKLDASNPQPYVDALLEWGKDRDFLEPERPTE